MAPRELVFAPPDDWHLHLREGAAMADVVGHSARQFARVLVMPNLRPPVSTVKRALAYRQEILIAAEQSGNFPLFDPKMTLYLTPQATQEEVQAAARSESVMGFKLYPAGATTHSDAGVTDLRGIYPILSCMQDNDLVLQIHGESIAHDCDIFDKEARFIVEQLVPLVQNFPTLRVVFEHITTQEAAEFVASCGPLVGATVTPQHLLYNRNEIFKGGIRPHYYCLPVLKRERHRQALLKAVSSGDPSFFLGTDSAPHHQGAKESACGCAGIFSAHAAIELYAQAFSSIDALDQLPAFASERGADFYRVPRNKGEVCLRQTPRSVPESYPFGEHKLIPLGAGSELEFSFHAPPLCDQSV